jgi:hypothetical protein
MSAPAAATENGKVHARNESNDPAYDEYELQDVHEADDATLRRIKRARHTAGWAIHNQGTEVPNVRRTLCEGRAEGSDINHFRGRAAEALLLDIYAAGKIVDAISSDALIPNEVGTARTQLIIQLSAEIGTRCDRYEQRMHQFRKLAAVRETKDQL